MPHFSNIVICEATIINQPPPPRQLINTHDQLYSPSTHQLYLPVKVRCLVRLYNYDGRETPRGLTCIWIVYIENQVLQSLCITTEKVLKSLLRVWLCYTTIYKYCRTPLWFKIVWNTYIGECFKFLCYMKCFINLFSVFLYDIEFAQKQRCFSQVHKPQLHLLPTKEPATYWTPTNPSTLNIVRMCYKRIYWMFKNKLSLFVNIIDFCSHHLSSNINEWLWIV